MTLESLLLSRDTDLVRVLRPTLEKLAIDVEICQEARAAADILVSEKFDAVIVDCDDLKGGLEVLPRENIWISNICTYCNPHDFHSYRYHRDTNGRQVGFIGVF